MHSAKSRDVRRSVTLAHVLVVDACRPSRLGGDRHAGLADELSRRLVEAHHRTMLVVRLGI
jgi:hypothetical protein